MKVDFHQFFILNGNIVYLTAKSIKPNLFIFNIFMIARVMKHFIIDAKGKFLSLVVSL